MTKREFLKELEDRLQMLDEKERKDMIEEYSQHISMCMKSGMKEEEAIEDFGDMDDLIAEILEAYHLDPEYEVKSRERSGKTYASSCVENDIPEKKAGKEYVRSMETEYFLCKGTIHRRKKWVPCIQHWLYM